MPPILIPPESVGSGEINSSRAAYIALEEQAAREFLRGDYLPIAQSAPVVSETAGGWWQSRPPSGRAVSAFPTYHAIGARSYAIVQYEAACDRVRWVIGMFASALSAEQYAIDHDMPRYDVFPATTVRRETP
jgi:hypothetical protein